MGSLQTQHWKWNVEVWAVTQGNGMVRSGEWEARKVQALPGTHPHSPLMKNWWVLTPEQPWATGKLFFVTAARGTAHYAVFRQEESAATAEQATDWQLGLPNRSDVWSLCHMEPLKVSFRNCLGLPDFVLGKEDRQHNLLALLLAITFSQSTQNNRLASLFPRQVSPWDPTGKDQQASQQASH